MAAVALGAGNPKIMGNIIDYVEALNGILLPSAMAFLILPANDNRCSASGGHTCIRAGSGTGRQAPTGAVRAGRRAGRAAGV